MLTKQSTENEIVSYFRGVRELSLSGKEFPVNFDEVWCIVYKDRRTAVAELKDKFLQDIDYQTVRKKVESSNIAGFTYGVIQGWTIPECQQFGARLSASVVTKFEPY